MPLGVYNLSEGPKLFLELVDSDENTLLRTRICFKADSAAIIFVHVDEAGTSSCRGLHGAFVWEVGAAVLHHKQHDRLHDSIFAQVCTTRVKLLVCSSIALYLGSKLSFEP